jgi:hypothetical protein
MDDPDGGFNHPIPLLPSFNPSENSLMLCPIELITPIPVTITDLRMMPFSIFFGLFSK